MIWFIFIYMLIINTNDYVSLADFERGIQKCSHIVMWINVGIKVIPFELRFSPLFSRWFSTLMYRTREKTALSVPQPV